MKNPKSSDLRISQMVVSSTRKRFSIIIAGLALVACIVGYFLIREKQVFISYLFLVVIAIEFILVLLFIFEKYMAAQIVAISSLWLLFAFVGISQGDVNTIMITGFLMLTIIAAYAFYIKGVVFITAANSLVLILTGWMDIMDLSFYKVDYLDPRAKILVSMIFILVGGSYMISTLDMLGKNYLKVREFQRRYLTLFNDSIDVIMIVSLDNKILDMNPIGLELTGYTFEEIHQLGIEELVIHEDRLDEILDDLRHARKVGSFEHQIRARNGDLIDVESIPTAVTDEDGTLLYFQVHMRDVRSRKRVENYLTEFKQRYEAMFERAEYGFLLLDMNLIIVAANHQAADILRCHLPELHNHAIKRLQKGNSYYQLLGDIEQLKQKGELSPRQYRLVTEQGNALWVEVNIGLVDTNDNQPQYLQWVMRDITEQKQRESHLLNALQEMETLAMTDPL
ncbi:MAG: PAS domain-containing protein, partial [Anaerolineales bacterium]